MFGPIELLASVGGFLSLVGGISVISIFEIFYFFVFRRFQRNVNQVSTATASKKRFDAINRFAQYLKKHFSSIHGMSNVEEGKVFMSVDRA